nr:hypothetical protein Itr_chr04CG06390 [Ipomoea trifida]
MCKTSTSCLSLSFSASKHSTFLCERSSSESLTEIWFSRTGTMATDSLRSFCSRSSVFNRYSLSRNSSTNRSSSVTSGGRGWTWAEERGK